ncbi:MAG: hypothetical protein NZM11_04915 [Anaerolineales bacterium]|nr:hypothetical protein [Anaerolineales bacterium]
MKIDLLRSGGMNTIPHSTLLAVLPVAELNESLWTFLEPVTSLLPDARLKAVAGLLVQGVVSSQSARGDPDCARGQPFGGDDLANMPTRVSVLRKQAVHTLDVAKRAVSGCPGHGRGAPIGPIGDWGGSGEL